MRLIFTIAALVMLSGCSKEAPETPANNQEPAAQNSIVEENDQCICTKEFRPVCGSDGTTYSNPCLAGCAGVEEFEEGSCKK